MRIHFARRSEGLFLDTARRGAAECDYILRPNRDFRTERLYLAKYINFCAMRLYCVFEIFLKFHISQIVRLENYTYRYNLFS